MKFYFFSDFVFIKLNNTQIDALALYFDISMKLKFIVNAQNTTEILRMKEKENRFNKMLNITTIHHHHYILYICIQKYRDTLVRRQFLLVHFSFSIQFDLSPSPLLLNYCGLIDGRIEYEL